MAMTADGKIATANRAVTTFGSRRDHDHLLELRATVDAVMCGADTASGDIDMGPGPEKYRRQRLRNGLAEYNLRIIVSGSGSIRPDAPVFQHTFSPILLLTTERMSKARRKALSHVADVHSFGDRSVDLPAAMAWLREEHGVNRLMLEGGGTLNDAMFRAGLVDEVHLTICPLLFGGAASPTIADGIGVDTLSDASLWELVRRKQYGSELFVTYRRRRG